MGGCTSSLNSSSEIEAVILMGRKRVDLKLELIGMDWM